MTSHLSYTCIFLKLVLIACTYLICWHSVYYLCNLINQLIINSIYWLLGTFALLQAYGFLVYIRSKVSWTDFKNIFIFAVVAVAGLVFIAVIFLTYAGKQCILHHFNFNFVCIHWALSIMYGGATGVRAVLMQSWHPCQVTFALGCYKNLSFKFLCQVSYSSTLSAPYSFFLKHSLRQKWNLWLMAVLIYDYLYDCKMHFCSDVVVSTASNTKTTCIGLFNEIDIFQWEILVSGKALKLFLLGSTENVACRPSDGI